MIVSYSFGVNENRTWVATITAQQSYQPANLLGLSSFKFIEEQFTLDDITISRNHVI